MGPGITQLIREQVLQLIELAGLLRDDAEACATAKHWRAAALLIAESVEAGLLATIRCSEPELRAQGAWPTDKRPLHHLELGALLTVARNAGWLVPTLPPHTTPAEALGGDIGDAVRSLQEVRNLAAHPGRVIAAGQLDFTDAVLMAQLYPVLEGIAGSVFEKLGEVINGLPDLP
jgi:hypothetical protein